MYHPSINSIPFLFWSKNISSPPPPPNTAIEGGSDYETIGKKDFPSLQTLEMVNKLLQLKLTLHMF